MTKDEILAEMHASFAEVDAVLDRIPADRLTETGVTEEWSVRDMLAHIAGYERYVAAAILGDLTGQTPRNQDLLRPQRRPDARGRCHRRHQQRLGGGPCSHPAGPRGAGG
jgi:hypothetical protein